MIVLGLTGGIGMGKSAVTKRLPSSIPVFDADKAVADLYEPLSKGGVWTYHGRDYRKAAGITRGKDEAIRMVMQDPAYMKLFAQIAHPFLIKQALTFIADNRHMKREFILLDVPLLFEMGWDKLLPIDVTITVSCPIHMQLERVLARPGMDRQRFANVIAQQLSDDERREKADFIVDTSGELEDTARQVEAVLLLAKNYRPYA